MTNDHSSLPWSISTWGDGSQEEFGVVNIVSESDEVVIARDVLKSDNARNKKY